MACLIIMIVIVNINDISWWLYILLKSIKEVQDLSPSASGKWCFVSGHAWTSSMKSATKSTESLTHCRAQTKLNLIKKPIAKQYAWIANQEMHLSLVISLASRGVFWINCSISLFIWKTTRNLVEINLFQLDFKMLAVMLQTITIGRQNQTKEKMLG